MVLQGQRGNVPACPIVVENTKIMNGLNATDQGYLKCPWTFALKAACTSAGPEYPAATSVKSQHQGSRTLVVADFEQLWKFAKSSCRQGAVITVKRIVDLLSLADKEMIEAMLKAGVTIWHGVVPEKATASVPWGKLVVERAENTADVLGFRWISYDF